MNENILICSSGLRQPSLSWSNILINYLNELILVNLYKSDWYYLNIISSTFSLKCSPAISFLANADHICEHLLAHPM